MSSRRRTVWILPATRTKLVISSLLVSVIYGMTWAGRSVQRVWQTRNSPEPTTVAPAKTPDPAPVQTESSPKILPAVEKDGDLVLLPTPIVIVADSVEPAVPVEAAVIANPVPTHPRTVRKSRRADRPAPERYVFAFAGTVTYLNEPCPNTQVTVRVSARGRTAVRRVQTDENAKYQVHVPIRARKYDGVDWSVEAVTPENVVARRFGKQIVIESPVEGIAVPLDGTLELASSRI